MKAATSRRLYESLKTAIRRQYSLVDRLEDNPLALRMSGLGYGRRGLLGWPRKRFPRPTAGAMLTAGLLYLLLPLTFYGIALVPLVSCMLRRNAFQRLWREEALSGRLMEWYLSMTPEEIVLGLVGGKLLRTRANHRLAAAALLFVAIAGGAYCQYRWNLTVATLLFFGAIAPILLLPVFAADSIYSTLEAISASVDTIASGSLSRQTGRRLEHSMRELTMAWTRFGLPLALSGLLALILAGMAMTALALANIQPPAALLAGLGLNLALALFAIFYFHIAAPLRQEAYSRAVGIVRERLASILELIPVDAGGATPP